MTSAPRLGRLDADLPAAPVRIVHLGLGAFHRAHQAWFTHRANSAAGEPWGISAFTGRRADEALRLGPQSGLYTLITRSATTDTAEIIASISEVHDGADSAAWIAAMSDPRVAILSLTITEAGYVLDAGTRLAVAAPVMVEDRLRLSSASTSAPLTAPGRIVQGLRARMRAGAGPITVLSCDNLPGNGAITRGVVLDLARLVDAELARWIEGNVAFPSTMVDRITPRTTADDLAVAQRLTGWADASPVVTEPYHDWVIEDAFVGERPNWEAVGALFVEDVTRYEQRKLLALNGAHSLLAYYGGLRGAETVDEAMADGPTRGWLEHWWRDVGTVLPFSQEELAAYSASIVERWQNPRMRHLLAQIATDGSQKIGMRVVPVMRAFRQRGSLSESASLIFASWLAHLRGHGAAVNDAAWPSLSPVAASPTLEAVRELLVLLAPDLAADSDLVVSIARHYDALPAEPVRAAPPAVIP